MYLRWHRLIILIWAYRLIGVQLASVSLMRCIQVKHLPINHARPSETPDAIPLFCEVFTMIVALLLDRIDVCLSLLTSIKLSPKRQVDWI